MELSPTDIEDLRGWHQALLDGRPWAWGLGPTNVCVRIGRMLAFLEDHYEVDPDAPDEPLAEAPVLAASTWRTNAELVDACFKLGYLQADWSIVDPTHGLGVWWNNTKPEHLVTHDSDIDKGDGVDFAALPEPDDTYDAAVFDPTYACMGGTETTTLPDYADRYGRRTAPGKPADLLAYNLRGLAELARVVRPRNWKRGYKGGYVLVKSMDYVWCGKVVPGTYQMQRAAEEMGFEFIQTLVHVGRIRPQPKRTKKGPLGPDGKPTRLPSSQQHAYANYSTLLVLRTPRFEPATLL